MTAFVYVRKSVMADDSTTLSPAVQSDRCVSLAAAHGDASPTILRDLDVSGAKVEERHGYMEMVEAIESGEAHAVYAYDLSRLHRNTEEALRFFRLASEHGVVVRMVEGNIDTSGPTGTLVLTVLAAMNAWTSKVTSAKIKASLAMKRARGESLGGRRYGDVRVIVSADGTERTVGEGEDVSAVVEAYRSTESPMGAARVLNAQHVPTRNGKSRGWSPSAVLSVVRHHAPDLLRDPATRGIRGSSGGERKHRLARLLRCSLDGSLLTGSVDRGVTRYACHGQSTRPHGRTQIMESIILDAIREETDRAALFVKKLRVGTTDDDAKLAVIGEERKRVNAMFRKGRIEEPEYDSAMTELDEQERGLTALRSIRRYTIPPDVRADDPAKVNGYLRRLFESVTVDMATPGKRGVPVPVAVDATWRDPAMRVEEVTA
jgi:DNA invertase Pin-like site-specific DNA recombinase